MKKPIKITLHVTQDHIDEGSMPENINTNSCIVGKACRALGLQLTNLHIAWNGTVIIGGRYYQGSRSLVRFLKKFMLIQNSPSKIKKQLKPFTFTLTGR
jgi:hypothetical protein